MSPSPKLTDREPAIAPNSDFYNFYFQAHHRE